MVLPVGWCVGRVLAACQQNQQQHFARNPCSGCHPACEFSVLGCYGVHAAPLAPCLQGGPMYRIQGLFMWSTISMDVLGISYYQLDAHKDPVICDIVRNHNKVVNGL